MLNIRKLFLIFVFSIILIGCGDGWNTGGSSNPKVKEYSRKANKEYKEGDYKKAIRYLNRALSIESSNSILLTKRGDCYRKIRKPRKALKDYTRAIKASSTNARAYYHRGTMKIILGDEDEGCEDVREAMKLAYFPAERYYKENCK